MNFEEYLKEFEPTIKKLARSCNIPPLEAEDVEQELRLHLFNKYDSSVKEFNGWAYIACRNRIKDLAKYHTRQKRDERKKSSLDEMIAGGLDI